MFDQALIEQCALSLILCFTPGGVEVLSNKEPNLDSGTYRAAWSGVSPILPSNVVVEAGKDSWVVALREPDTVGV